MTETIGPLKDGQTGRPALGPLLAATMSVTDPARSRQVYGRWLDYRPAADGRVSAALAAAWSAPAAEGARWELLAPASGAPGGLRLVEAPPVSGYQPLRSFGWAAAEMTVVDVDGLAERLNGTPFRIVGPPRALSSISAIKAMQMVGPDGEVIYLSDLSAYEGRFDVARATVPVDRAFISVLAAPDLEATRTFYETHFKLQRMSDHEVVYPVLNDAFGRDADGRHRISSLQLAGQNVIEIDQYPDAATARPAASGHLPPGAAMMTFATPALDRLDVDFLSPPQPLAEPPYDGSRVALCRGAAGELIELVETRALPGQIEPF